MFALRFLFRAKTWRIVVKWRLNAAVRLRSFHNPNGTGLLRLRSLPRQVFRRPHMTNATRYLATGSVIALMTVFSASANAQDNDRSNRGEKPSMQDGMSSGGSCEGVECMPGRTDDQDGVGKPDNTDRTMRRKDDDKQRNVNVDEQRKIKRKGDNDRQDANRKDDDEQRGSKNREARSDWKYDGNRHKRSRNKDVRFRYYYGGYWYDQQYWALPVYGRVGCGEGREIVGDSGFNRVRTIECSGRTYTYAARRKGDMYRVSVNSRTGEIVNVRPM